jgi:hypothetical protein
MGQFTLLPRTRARIRLMPVDGDRHSWGGIAQNCQRRKCFARLEYQIFQDPL